MDDQALVLMSPMQTCHNDESKMLQCLNLKLQVKVHNLENEVGRLKKEIQSHKGKSSIYESLTKDLALLRTQFDKTAAALLRKCEAYDTLKKEMTALKSKYNISTPKNCARSKLSKILPINSFKTKLALYEDCTEYSSDEEIYSNRRGRPSMGSCGNIAKQITEEEGLPSHLKAYAAPAAPLRNRLLIKLHSLKAASTESLESTGRKSIKLQEVIETKSSRLAAGSRKGNRTNLNSSLQSSKGSSAQPSVKAPPAIRPALGQSNGHRLVKMNAATIKRTNSGTSSKSGSGSTKPAFRL